MSSYHDLRGVWSKRQEMAGTDHPGWRLNNLTTVQRDGLTGSGAAKAGDIIWNTTTAAVEFYDGSTWSGVPVSVSEAELGFIDGVTAGTAAASKAVVLDSGTKVTGIKQITYAAGTATVAPIVLTSGTNLTTAAAGAAEFDGKVFYLTAAASSRQVADAEQFIIQASNSSTYNNTGLDTNSAFQVFSAGSGLVSVQAATTYFFEGLYKLSNTGTTSHTWATLFTLASSASLTGISYTVMGDTRTTSAATIAATSQLDIGVATQVPVTAASTSATEFVTLFLKGYMAVNAAGTVSPAMQASARPGATGTPGVIVLAGSYFRMWPVGSNAVTSVGSWA